MARMYLRCQSRSYCAVCIISEVHSTLRGRLTASLRRTRQSTRGNRVGSWPYSSISPSPVEDCMLHSPGVGKIERVVVVGFKGLGGPLNVLMLHLEVPGRQVRDGDVDVGVLLRVLRIREGRLHVSWQRWHWRRSEMTSVLGFDAFPDPDGLTERGRLIVRRLSVVLELMNGIHGVREQVGGRCRGGRVGRIPRIQREVRRRRQQANVRCSERRQSRGAFRQDHRARPKELEIRGMHFDFPSLSQGFDKSHSLLSLLPYSTSSIELQPSVPGATGDEVLVLSSSSVLSATHCSFHGDTAAPPSRFPAAGTTPLSRPAAVYVAYPSCNTTLPKNTSRTLG